jgi:hypothetical protein
VVHPGRGGLFPHPVVKKSGNVEEKPGCEKAGEGKKLWLTVREKWTPLNLCSAKEIRPFLYYLFDRWINLLFKGGSLKKAL